MDDTIIGMGILAAWLSGAYVGYAIGEFRLRHQKALDGSLVKFLHEFAMYWYEMASQSRQELERMKKGTTEVKPCTQLSATDVVDLQKTERTHFT
jgi:hypothetical protein